MKEARKLKSEIRNKSPIEMTEITTPQPHDQGHREIETGSSVMSSRAREERDFGQIVRFLTGAARMDFTPS